MCQSLYFFTVINAAVWWGILMGEVLMHIYGEGVYEKSWYFPLKFDINLKTSFKNSLSKIKFLKLLLLLTLPLILCIPWQVM
jgi:hypothetical protein